ncbi:Receptor activity-modifying protein 1 [Nibea albiflora]|uniref:Receptor activity-modifying protein 1 n=1 Tax=Nibea albiflora TaxID=240163 RepID=A0ACB7EFH6_NIBAL|nr:Receptor activity-modifying protein 1 [Nibea albiflora]
MARGWQRGFLEDKEIKAKLQQKYTQSAIAVLPQGRLSDLLYGELTNCTFLVAMKLECFWPNRLVDEFFIRVHRHYFHDCSLTGRLLTDPPNSILGPFIAVPILVTLLMTALVVWRSKRSEGIV